MKPTVLDRVLPYVLPIVLLFGIFGAACLVWWSFGRHDYWAAAFFFVVLLIGVYGPAWLASAEDDPSNVVDLEERRKQLSQAAMTTDKYRMVR